MKINAAIIGSGVGLRHLEAINNYRGSRVKTICEFNKTRIKLLKKKFPKLLVTSSIKEVMKDKSINLLSIASYDQYHFSQIIEGLKNKKNLIIEKPMCLEIGELKKIFNILKKNKRVKIISNLVLRTEPVFRYIKRNINKDKLFYIEADYIWGRLHKLKNGWRTKTKNYSLILGAAIHMIDLVMWFLNDKPKKVIAIGNRNLTKNTKFKKISFSTCILEFPKDIIVKITANSTNNYNHSHEVKIFQLDKTIIHSEKGLQIIRKSKNNIKKKNISLKYPLKQNRKYLIRSFIDDLMKKGKPIVTLKEQFDLRPGAIIKYFNLQVCFFHLFRDIIN